jgi:hypothetical protein
MTFHETISDPIVIPHYTALVYAISKMVAVAGWLLLAVSLFTPRWRPKLWPLAQFVLPAILCILYVLMVIDGRDGFDRYGLGTFFSLEGVGWLYTKPSALNAGWLHFLALDLFAGSWIVRDGVERRIPTLLLLLCLPFVLMLAPLGLLLYLILRYLLRSRAPAPEA